MIKIKIDFSDQYQYHKFQQYPNQQKQKQQIKMNSSDQHGGEDKPSGKSGGHSPYGESKWLQ